MEKSIWDGPFRVSGLLGACGPKGEDEMQLFTFIGAVLLALLALSLPALAHIQHRSVIRESWRHPLRLALGVLSEELGVAIVYTYPGNGAGGTSATGPTSAAAAQVPVQTAQVFFAAGDTEAIVVHNRGLQASFPAQLFPVIVMTKTLGAADTSFASVFTFGKSNTNQVYIEKLAGDLGGTYDVALFFGDGPWMK